MPAADNDQLALATPSSIIIMIIIALLASLCKPRSLIWALAAYKYPVHYKNK